MQRREGNTRMKRDVVTVPPAKSACSLLGVHGQDSAIVFFVVVAAVIDSRSFAKKVT